MNNTNKFLNGDTVYWFDYDHNKLCKGIYNKLASFTICGEYYAEIKGCKHPVALHYLCKNKTTLIHSLHITAKEDYKNAEKRMNWAKEKLAVIEKLLQEDNKSKIQGKTPMSANERKAKKHIISVCNYVTGGYDNILLDAPENSPEYIKAKAALADREKLKEEIYQTSLHETFDFPFSEQDFKSFRFLGKQFAMNIIENYLTKEYGE